MCPAEQDTEWQIQWPTTAPDSTQSVRCLGEGDTPGLGLAHRRCLADAMWGPVDASECESVAVRAVRMKVGQNHVNCVHLIYCHVKKGHYKMDGIHVL